MLYMEGSTEPLRAILADIGLGGVQLQTKLPLDLGEPCRLHVGRDAAKPLEISGVVVYSHPTGEEGLYISGFKFLPADHAERSAVATYVHTIFQREWEELAI